MIYDLSEELQDFVSTQVGRKPAEQFQISEELALFRHAVNNSVKMYEAARSMPTENPKRNQHILAAGEVMKDSLMAVANLASKAAAIDATVSQKLTVSTITFVIESVLQVAIQEIAKMLPAELAEQLTKNIEDAVEQKISFDSGRGTKLLPHDDVSEMDELISVSHRVVEPEGE
jgi:transcription termination factor NusB